MSPSYQTIRISAGPHQSHEDGACAMELSTMLAGEPFSDHPRSVCPVIAAFLRSYNDHIDDERRADLYPYAARAVGTRAEPDIEQARARECLRWARATCERPPVHVRVLHLLFRCQGPDVHGVYAARAAIATDAHRPMHARALQFLDDLLATTEVGKVGIGIETASERPLAALGVTQSEGPP